MATRTILNDVLRVCSNLSVGTCMLLLETSWEKQCRHVHTGKYPIQTLPFEQLQLYVCITLGWISRWLWNAQGITVWKAFELTNRQLNNNVQLLWIPVFLTTRNHAWSLLTTLKYKLHTQITHYQWMTLTDIYGSCFHFQRQFMRYCTY